MVLLLESMAPIDKLSEVGGGHVPPNTTHSFRLYSLSLSYDIYYTILICYMYRSVVFENIVGLI